MARWLFSAVAFVLAVASCGAPRPRPATTPATPAPVSRAANEAPATGLLARLRDDKREVVTVVRTPSFTLRAGETIHPALGPAFEATWTGALVIGEAGTYELDAAGGSGAKLRIDGREVARAPLELGAGEHALELQVRRADGPARLQLRWKSASFDWEPVPAAVLRPKAWPQEAELWRRIDRGRTLADELNCRGCHVRRGDDVASERFRDVTRRGRGPMLTTVGQRVQPAWIASWLAEPRALRHDAKMPVLLREERDRRDVAAFLAGLRGEGYAPQGSDVIDLERDAKPMPERMAEARRLYEGIGCTACHGSAAGQVSLDGVGSKMSVAGLLDYLANYWLPGRIDQSGRMPVLVRDDAEALRLAQLLAQWQRPTPLRAVGPGDARRGRSVFLSAGCTGCHELSIDGERLFGGPKAPNLEALPGRGGRGCLAPEPASPAPRYPLTGEQREDLALYLDHLDTGSPAPLWEWRRTVESRRCNACHEVEAPAHVRMHEAPPSLAEAGNKLRPQWIDGVLDGRARVRPWLSLRMPKYHRPGGTGELFAAAAGAPAEVTVVDSLPTAKEPTEPVAREGVRYIGRGEEGMACITCHDVGTWKSGSATPGPDIATMGARLRPEWFRRWLLDPLRIQPGTQMPAFFADVERGMAEQRIGAIWAALSLGSKMPAPEGVTFDDKALPFGDGKRVAVARTFLPGSSPRSIAVGFPGGASFAFDAEACRLAYVWSGGFLDMRPVWNERGGEMAKPLGPTRWRAPERFPLRFGDPAAAPPKPKFRGYARRKDGTPTFAYDVDGRLVQETITVERDGRIMREYEISPAVAAAAPGDVFYVAEPGDGTDVSAKGANPAGAGMYRAKLAAGKPTRFSITLRPRPANVAANPAR